MNIYVNLVPKKKLIKKIIILTIFAILCFFIKENVFAADLDGNDYSAMPPFLEEYYDYSTTDATCDDETQGYCNLYNNLEQHFAEYHTLYQKTVMLTQYNPGSGYYYYIIYFFLDTPYISATNASELGDLKSLNFLDSDGEPLKYYRITFRSYYQHNINISYYYGSEDNSSQVPFFYDDRTYITDIKTNFDLYSQSGYIFHESDVLNFTYVNVPGGAGIGLIPKVSDNLGSYINYNKENIYGFWYDIENESYETKTAFDKPVSGNLTYNLDFSSFRVGYYYYYVVNEGTTTAKIGYIPSDFDVIVYNDFYSDGLDSAGNSYKNPMGTIHEEIIKENENVFDSIANLPGKIASGFKSFFDSLGQKITDLGSNIINGIKSLFIPGDELEGFFEEEYEYLKEQLGFLVYPIDVLVDFANRFYELDNNTSAVFKIPKLKVFEHTLYEGTTFDLMTLVNNNESIKNLYSLYRIAVSGFIVLWLVQLAVKKEHEIFGGGN